MLGNSHCNRQFNNLCKNLRQPVLQSLVQQPMQQLVMQQSAVQQPSLQQLVQQSIMQQSVQQSVVQQSVQQVSQQQELIQQHVQSQVQLTTQPVVQQQMQVTLVSNQVLQGNPYQGILQEQNQVMSQRSYQGKLQVSNQGIQDVPSEGTLQCPYQVTPQGQNLGYLRIALNVLNKSNYQPLQLQREDLGVLQQMPEVASLCQPSADHSKSKLDEGNQTDKLCGQHMTEVGSHEKPEDQGQESHDNSQLIQVMSSQTVPVSDSEMLLMTDVPEQTWLPLLPSLPPQNNEDQSLPGLFFIEALSQYTCVGGILFE